MANSQTGAGVATLNLPRKLDRTAAFALARDLSARTGVDLDLDARQTLVLGTLAVQVILSAAQTWRRTGHAFRLTGLGPEGRAQIELLGLGPAALGEETAP
jgi:anti-anti-sigma regulatory factor